MARKAKEKSAKAKAVDAANEALQKTKDAHGKSATEANLKAYKHAKDKADAAMKELARERFETIGGHRVTVVLTSITALGKVANRKSYDFSESDVAKIKTALNEAMADCLSRFDNALKGGEQVSKAEPFRFS